MKGVLSGLARLAAAAALGGIILTAVVMPLLVLFCWPD